MKHKDSKRFTEDLILRNRKHHAVMEAYLKHDRPVEWYNAIEDVWVPTNTPWWEKDVEYRVIEETK